MKGLSLYVLAFAWTVCCTAPAALAQGLIWNLPESGTWVRYAGEYRQTTLRPQSSEGDLLLQWNRVLEIRCLERETAEWKGAEVTCVWVEFEVKTGVLIDSEIDAGPGSVRLYKVLIPEQEILGKAFLELEVPRAYLPIVKGYRKIGEGEAEELNGHVFQTYPLLSQVLINEHASLSGQETTIETPLGSFASEQIENTSSIENASTRTTNTTQMWLSEEMPFGAVKWTVRVERETKTLVDTRDLFTKHSEISVEMQAAAQGADAVSRLETP